MEKLYNRFLVAKFLSLALMMSFLSPSFNKSLQAQTSPAVATPTTSVVTNNPINEQSSSTIAFWTLIISGFAAFGTILSGIAAVKALRKSSEKSQNTISLIKFALEEVFPLLENQAKTEKEKQRLVEKQGYFVHKLRELDKLYDESKKAEKWLVDNREKLADESAYYALPSAPQELRKNFRSNINDYLYLIHNCLDIGEPSLIDDELKNIQQASPKSDYEKALLEFVIAKKAHGSNLSETAIAAINYYTGYLINNLN